VSAKLWDDGRSVSIPVDQLREGAHGQYVVRLSRKRANHPSFDAREDARYERVLAGFVAWLELDDGTLRQVVRVSEPKGALLFDTGKWAVEYAAVS
jgi:hypothetical protein